MKCELIEYHRNKAAQHKAHPDGTPRRVAFHERAAAWLESQDFVDKAHVEEFTKLVKEHLARTSPPPPQQWITCPPEHMEANLAAIERNVAGNNPPQQCETQKV